LPLRQILVSRIKELASSRRAGRDCCAVRFAAKRRITDLVVRQRKLIAGNFSEPVTTSADG
jgi:hypothetical protein